MTLDDRGSTHNMGPRGENAQYSNVLIRVVTAVPNPMRTATAAVLPVNPTVVPDLAPAAAALLVWRYQMPR